MNIHDITSLVGKDKKRFRIGRGPGSGNGKTAGKGTKGASSRSGDHQRGFNEGGQMNVVQRAPKRGFSNARFRKVFHEINVSVLENRFEAGSVVDAAALRRAGLIGHVRIPVKVLGNGELKKRLTVKAAKFTRSAEAKIKGAGGEVVVEAGPRPWVRQRRQG